MYLNRLTEFIATRCRFISILRCMEVGLMLSQNSLNLGAFLVFGLRISDYVAVYPTVRDKTAKYPAEITISECSKWSRILFKDRYQLTFKVFRCHFCESSCGLIKYSHGFIGGYYYFSVTSFNFHSVAAVLNCKCLHFIEASLTSQRITCCNFYSFREPVHISSVPVFNRSAYSREVSYLQILAELAFPVSSQGDVQVIAQPAGQ